jgi:general secretion pathway protein G
VTATDDSYSDPDQTEPGINDVHSGSSETGSDGQPYSSW